MKKGFLLKLNKKLENLTFQKKGLQILLLVVFVFILGLIFMSTNGGDSFCMGSAVTVDGLESRWAGEYKLFLPGTIEAININTADQEALEALPGVGEKIAKEIIKYREKIGLFQETEEIINVPGIGIKKLNQMKEFIIAE